MKKILSGIIAVLILWNGTSCSYMSGQADNDKILSQVYEINDAVYSGTATDDFANHKNVITDTPECMVEKNVGEKTTLHILEKEQTISYQDTMYYPVGDVKVDRYTIEESQDSCFLLNSDGTVNSIINSSIATLDIAPNTSPQKVQNLLKIAVKDIVDLSKYQYCKDSSTPRQDGTYGLYIFTFYNQTHGFTSDIVKIMVQGSGIGTVSTLRKKLPLPDLSSYNFQVSKSKQEEIIQMKLIDMYNTEETEYLAHEVTEATIVMYKGEVCIKYFVNVDVLLTGTNQKPGYACRILVPLHLLTEG